MGNRNRVFPRKREWVRNRPRVFLIEREINRARVLGAYFRERQEQR